MTMLMVSLRRLRSTPPVVPAPTRSRRRFRMTGAGALASLAVAANDTPMVPVKGQTGLAWIVVGAIFLAALLILVVSASSQDNVSTSVDGNKAIYSHDLPDSGK